jgi:hypothetical protein
LLQDLLWPIGVPIFLALLVTMLSATASVSLLVKLHQAVPAW